MKAKEDKVMIEEYKRLLANRLEEKSSNVQKLTNTQINLMNQLMIANQELNRKNIEIATMKSQNDLLSNELRIEKEFIERFNKPSKAIKYFEQLMNTPRTNSDTIGLGYFTTKVRESSKSCEKRSNKRKINKPTCHHVENQVTQQMSNDNQLWLENGPIRISKRTIHKVIGYPTLDRPKTLMSEAK